MNYAMQDKKRRPHYKCTADSAWTSFSFLVGMAAGITVAMIFVQVVL
jgi:hypothetical protein